MTDPLLTLLYQAYAAEIGIVVHVNDYVRDTQALYAARRKAGDPRLDRLQFRRSPESESEAWIINLTGVEASLAHTPSRQEQMLSGAPGVSASVADQKENNVE